MEKELKILDEIILACDNFKQIKENSKSHVGLRELLKLNEKIINLCKIVNISYKNIEKTENFYSKIRNRVSNMRQSIKKRELKANQKVKDFFTS